MIIGYLTESIIGNKIGEGVFYTYNSVLIFPASVCLFMTFKHLNIKNKFINRFGLSLGAVCFGVYLATDNPLVRNSLWSMIDLPKYYGMGTIICAVLVIATVSVLLFFGCAIEKIRMNIFSGIGIDRIFGIIDGRVEHLVQKLRLK